MSAFVELCLVALVLFVWESVLWIPLRGVCLQISHRHKAIHVKLPNRWFSTKNNGCVFHSWWPGSGSVLPVQTPPLLVDPQGRWLLQRDDDRDLSIAPPLWEEISWQHPYLRIGTERVKLTSGRCLDALWRGKKAGLSPADAVRSLWQESLSTTLAACEWKKWRTVAAPLRWLQPLLFLGLICGLALYCVQGERFSLALFLTWIFLVMGMIAGHVWWLGRKIYPSCQSAVMMDAVLCLLVPFHSMRAAESVSLQAMGRTHPYAMLLRFAPSHPWFVKQMRILTHPRPCIVEDEIRYAALKPLLHDLLTKKDWQWSDFDQAPHESRDSSEVSYCPRCHAHYLDGVSTCRDCRNYPLRRFE